jgi:hypothetical protein
MSRSRVVLLFLFVLLGMGKAAAADLESATTTAEIALKAWREKDQPTFSRVTSPDQPKASRLLEVVTLTAFELVGASDESPRGADGGLARVVVVEYSCSTVVAEDLRARMEEWLRADVANARASNAPPEIIARLESRARVHRARSYRTSGALRAEKAVPAPRREQREVAGRQDWPPDLVSEMTFARTRDHGRTRGATHPGGAPLPSTRLAPSSSSPGP